MTKTRRKISFADWVSLVRSLQHREWEEGGITGTLTVSDSDQASLLLEIFDRGAAGESSFPCQILQGDPDSMQVGSIYQINLARPRLGIGHLFENAEEWLRNRNVLQGKLENWYIADRNWLAGETSDDLSAAYAVVSDFVAILSEVAPVVDKTDAVLVFLPGERFDIPIRYDVTHLQGLHCATLQEIVNLAQIEDGHTKQRREILATAVCDLVKDTPHEKRLGYLLEHSKELLQRFKDGYSLFASSFSFEKVRDQVEAMRVDYTSRIHKAISDIQGHLLGIPISTILVATQMKDVEAPGALMWGNIAVVAGAFIFVVVLFLALRNQWHTLDVLSTELERQVNVTRKEQPEMAERFSKVFSDLNDRIGHQRLIIVIIGVISAFGLSLAFTMFWAMTKPALSIFF